MAKKRERHQNPEPFLKEDTDSIASTKTRTKASKHHQKQQKVICTLFLMPLPPPPFYVSDFLMIFCSRWYRRGWARKSWKRRWFNRRRFKLRKRERGTLILMLWRKNYLSVRKSNMLRMKLTILVVFQRLKASLMIILSAFPFAFINSFFFPAILLIVFCNFVEYLFSFIWFFWSFSLFVKEVKLGGLTGGDWWERWEIAGGILVEGCWSTTNTYRPYHWQNKKEGCSCFFRFILLHDSPFFFKISFCLFYEPFI